jgi:hypothetical protein
MSNRREPDLRGYIQELRATLRRRDPAAYRAFVARWRDVLQRGAAERLLAADDATLRLRMERMILDNPGLADLHSEARAYLAAHGVTPGVTPSRRGGRPRLRPRRTVRLRRRRAGGDRTPEWRRTGLTTMPGWRGESPRA